MIKNKLGKSNISICPIGLGTVQFGLDYGFSKQKTQDEVNTILYTAQNLGINLLDTARAYGSSEEKIGHYIYQNKNSFVIATKLRTISEYTAKNVNLLYDEMRASIELSLKSLKVDKIDILQIHQIEDYIIKNENIWTILDKFKHEGLITALGSSVYDLDETHYLLKNYTDIIDILQIPLNIFDQRFSEIKDKIDDNNIGIISRSTFLKGIIACDIEKIPKELKDIIPYKEKFNKFAKSSNLSTCEIALLFVVQSKLTDTTIIGVDNSEELIDNYNAIENNMLEYNFDSIQLKVSDKFLIDPRQWNF